MATWAAVAFVVIFFFLNTFFFAFLHVIGGTGKSPTAPFFIAIVSMGVLIYRRKTPEERDQEKLAASAAEAQRQRNAADWPS
jgi:hypothetical protein